MKTQTMDGALKKLHDIGERIAKIDTVEARTAAVEKLIEEIQAEFRKNSLSLPGSEDVAKKYSIGRAMRGMLTGDWKDAGLEFEVHTQTFKRLSSQVQQRVMMDARVMTTVTPSAGGFLIPEEISTVIIPKRDTMSVCKMAGATVVKPNGWPFKVNKITGGTTAGYAAEGGSVSASDMTFDQVEFNPRKMSARSIITKEQVMYGTPQTDKLVADDIAIRLALLQDYWALRGSGASGEPLGIINTTGINTAAALTSGKLRFVDINVALAAIEADDVILDNNPVIVAHSNKKYDLYRDFSVNVASGTEANQGVVYVAPGGVPIMTVAKLKEMTGLDFYSSNQLASTIAIIGGERFSKLWMAEFGGVAFSTSDIASDGTHHAFVDDKVHVKGTMWCDSAVVQAESFHVVTAA